MWRNWRRWRALFKLWSDPIGGFKLPTGYFQEMGAAVRELDVPTIVTQEGGYSLDAIGPCVAGLLAGLSEP